MHDRIVALAEARAGRVVVDLGCGSGATLAALCGAVAGVRLVGLDLHAARLKDAANRLGSTLAVLVRANLTLPLPLADGCVDAVVCHNVLELLPNPLSLLAEVVRVLRPGGRAILSHTDFAGLVVYGGDPVLTASIIDAYAHVAQPWMSHIDPYTARRLPGLAAKAGLVIDYVDGHVLAAHRLDGPGRHRLNEVAAVARAHVQRGLVDFTDADVDWWWQQLLCADERGEFCFAETALITVARRPGP